MLNELLSYALAIGGVIIVIMIVIRSAFLPPLARCALIGSAFGLFMSSRYVSIDHSIDAAIFTCGVAGMMALVALRHLHAFRPV